MSQVLRVRWTRMIPSSSWKGVVYGITGVIAVNFKNPEYRRSLARSADIAGRARSADRSDSRKGLLLK